jgi:hypothetical protein
LPSRARQDRLQQLARSIDALAEEDGLLFQRAEQMGETRRKAAVELHRVCASFARKLNALLKSADLVLDPPDYEAERFRDAGVNLFQLNVRGRILQIEFEATPELISTENFRVPYTLEGAVRCFNQQLLERDLIEEQLLFYCVEKGGAAMWRFFDGRTYRTGPFDEDYLLSLMEQLL